MCRDADTPDPVFTDTLELDLGGVVPSLAGPKRPQDRVLARERQGRDSSSALEHRVQARRRGGQARAGRRRQTSTRPRRRRHRGDHLVHQHLQPERDDRRRAARPEGRRAKGLKPKPWVKTSLAPGSQVVGEYLAKSGPAGGSRRARLQPRRLRLHHLHRQFRPAAGDDLGGDQRQATSSPPRCFPATAISRAASIRTCAPTTSPRRRWSSPMRSPARCRSTSPASRSASDPDGKPVYLKDIWPTSTEIAGVHPREHHRARCSGRNTPTSSRATSIGRKITVEGGLTYEWDTGSTYVQNPPYFEGMRREPGADHRHRRRPHPRPLPRFDHHRPHLAGRLDQARRPGRRLSDRASGAAGRFQPVRHPARQSRSDDARHLRQYPHQEPDGAPDVEGGVTVHQPDGERMPIYDAAMRYQAEGVPLVIFAGKEYGTGSSRDWAAKGTRLLGVRAVIAAELRAHPPLQPRRHGRRCRSCSRRAAWQTLGLKGDETVTIRGPRRRAQAAPDARRRDHLRRRQRSSACRCSAGSTRSTSSNTSTMAASCTTCCASSRHDCECRALVVTNALTKSNRS